jgi:hypothetical protein
MGVPGHIEHTHWLRLCYHMKVHVILYWFEYVHIVFKTNYKKKLQVEL